MPSENNQPNRPRPTNSGTSVAPRVGRKPTYSMSRHGNIANAHTSDDMTIRRDVQVALVRPNYFGNPLVFRMLPAPSYDDPEKFESYCDPGTGAVSDVIRVYPVARGIGSREKYTFIMYNPEVAHYDVRTNPYKVIYDRVYRAVKIDREFPRIRGVRPEEWLTYIERSAGKAPPLAKPTSAYYCRGIVFANGDNVYVGRDVSPRGLGDRDLPQIVQLPVSAGRQLWEMMMVPNDAYAGPAGNWEQSLLHGDLVHPRFGRFITIAGKQGRNDNAAADDLDYSVGGSSGRDSQNQKTSFAGEGYSVSIDQNLVLKGRVTKITAQLRPEALKLIRKRSVWFDDLFDFPDHDRICAICAMAFQDKPHILYYGWEDHPEFFTAEVKRLLKNAKTAASAGVPGTEDDDVFDDDHEDKSGRPPAEASAVVPGDEYDYGYGDVEAEQQTDTAGGANASDDYNLPVGTADSVDDDVYATDPIDEASPQATGDAAFDDEDYVDDEVQATDGNGSAKAEAATDGYADIPDDTDNAGSAKDMEEIEVQLKMDAARAAANRRSASRANSKPRK